MYFIYQCSKVAFLLPCFYTRSFQMLLNITRRSKVFLYATSRHQENNLFVRGMSVREFDQETVLPDFAKSLKGFSEKKFGTYRLKQITHTAFHLHENLNREDPDLRAVLAVIETVKGSKRRVNISKEFKEAYGFLQQKSLLADNTSRAFQKHCESVSEVELTSLLFELLRCNRYIDCNDWPVRTKHLFNTIEVEMCRRLNSCFEKTNYNSKKVLVNYHLMARLLLQNKCGFRFFQTYTRYYSYCLDSLLDVDNLPLLLLGLFKVNYKSLVVFESVEDFILRHIKSLDIQTISLFCVTSFVCRTQVTSEELLDQIGMKILQRFRRTTTIREHDFTHLNNILKIFRFSGYTKLSFFLELDLMLASGDFIECCQLRDLMGILKTYRSMNICPTHSIDKMVNRCKYHLKHTGRKPRIKDISSVVYVLGQIQYIDSSNQDDIYELCVKALMGQLDYSRKFEAPFYKAFYVFLCASGLAYVRKFHHALLDKLFGLPNVVTYLSETRLSELLMLYHAVKAECPEYRGNFISQDTIERLYEAESDEWNIDIELRVVSHLQESVDILKSLLGRDSVRVHYILPYIRTADIELFTDDLGRGVKPEMSTKKVAVALFSCSQVMKGTERLLGRGEFKLRHLKLHDYHIIKVFPSEREEIMNYGSKEEKTEFWIQKLLDNGIKINHPKYKEKTVHLGQGTKQKVHSDEDIYNAPLSKSKEIVNQLTQGKEKIVQLAHDEKNIVYKNIVRLIEDKKTVGLAKEKDTVRLAKDKNTDKLAEDINTVGLAKDRENAVRLAEVKDTVRLVEDKLTARLVKDKNTARLAKDKNTDRLAKDINTARLAQDKNTNPQFQDNKTNAQKEKVTSGRIQELLKLMR